MVKFFDLNHLQETNMTYTRHLTHGFYLGILIFLYSILSFINCVLKNKKIQNYIVKKVKYHYHGLMITWLDYDFNQKVAQKDSLRVRDYRKDYVEKIRIGIIKPNTNFKNSYELLLTSISSIVHSIIPQIFVYHAAINVVKLYFNYKLVEEINGKQKSSN